MNTTLPRQSKKVTSFHLVIMLGRIMISHDISLLAILSFQKMKVSAPEPDIPEKKSVRFMQPHSFPRSKKYLGRGAPIIK